MANRASVDHTTMREMNLSLILNTLRLAAPISRAGLAVQTGLNKATVSSMVKDLLSKDFIRELDPGASSSEIGRPAIGLSLNPDAGYIISAEIGVGFISIIVTDFALEIVTRHYENGLETYPPELILKRVIALLQKTYAQTKKRSKPIFGLAVGIPGLVDMSAGTLLFAPNMNWRNIPLRQILESEFPLPIYIANEANMAALGESYFSGRNNDFLLYVSSGVGLGGGIVLNGRLLTGATGLSGEVGHMTVDPDGLSCHCGNTGCWETLGSQQALFRRIHEAVSAGRPSAILDMTGGDMSKLSVPMIVQAAQNGDSTAAEALEETGRWLGIGLANLINVIDPQRVVFGGPLSLAEEFVLPVIREVVKQRAFPGVRQPVEITSSMHLADAAVMGGVAMVHHEVVSAPLRWL